MRDFYFDSIEPGQSTERFWAQLHRAISEHDTALGALRRVRVTMAGGA